MPRAPADTRVCRHRSCRSRLEPGRSPSPDANWRQSRVPRTTPEPATPPLCSRSLRPPPHHWPAGSCQNRPTQSASISIRPACRRLPSSQTTTSPRFGRRCQSPVALAPPAKSDHMTGATGDTTTTDARSQRNRAGRRGGQLLTRARG